MENRKGKGEKLMVMYSKYLKSKRFMLKMIKLFFLISIYSISFPIIAIESIVVLNPAKEKVIDELARQSHSFCELKDVDRFTYNQFWKQFNIGIEEVTEICVFEKIDHRTFEPFRDEDIDSFKNKLRKQYKISKNTRFTTYIVSNTYNAYDSCECPI